MGSHGGYDIGDCLQFAVVGWIEGVLGVDHGTLTYTDQRGEVYIRAEDIYEVLKDRGFEKP